MYEIFDEFTWTKQNKTITQEHHRVPALGNFTYWNCKHSPTPTPMHYHSDIIEIHCLISGKRLSQIEKEGTLEQFVYTGNEMFLTLPFEIHGSGNEPQSPCEFYAFQINVSNPDNMLGLNKDYSNLLYYTLLGLEHRHYKLGSTHLQYLRTSFNFFSDMVDSSTMIGAQYLCCFLFSFQFLQPITDSFANSIDERIHSAILFLNENIKEPLQVCDLASISGYSLSRFKIKFKEEVGITPAEYITLQKLEYAKKMLTTSDISITDLAFLLGFSTSNYFSSVFKRIMSCTPKEYRNRNLQVNQIYLHKK